MSRRSYWTAAVLKSQATHPQGAAQPDLSMPQVSANGISPAANPVDTTAGCRAVAVPSSGVVNMYRMCSPAARADPSNDSVGCKGGAQADPGAVIAAAAVNGGDAMVRQQTKHRLSVATDAGEMRMTPKADRGQGGSPPQQQDLSQSVQTDSGDVPTQSTSHQLNAQAHAQAQQQYHAGSIQPVSTSSLAQPGSPRAHSQACHKQLGIPLAAPLMQSACPPPPAEGSGHHLQSQALVGTAMSPPHTARVNQLRTNSPAQHFALLHGHPLEHVDTAGSSNVRGMLAASLGSLNSSTLPVQIGPLQHCSSSMGNMGRGLAETTGGIADVTRRSGDGAAVPLQLAGAACAAPVPYWHITAPDGAAYKRHMSEAEEAQTAQAACGRPSQHAQWNEKQQCDTAERNEQQQYDAAQSSLPHASTVHIPAHGLNVNIDTASGGVDLGDQPDGGFHVSKKVRRSNEDRA